MESPEKQLGGPEGPGGGKTVVRVGLCERWEVPATTGRLSLQTEVWAGTWLLARGLHEPWPLAPRLAAWGGAGPASHCHPASLFPLQGTSRPKGKHCQTIGHPGKPSGTGLCVSDKGADINTALLTLSVLLCLLGRCLPCPCPQGPCSLGKGDG